MKVDTEAKKAYWKCVRAGCEIEVTISFDVVVWPEIQPEPILLVEIEDARLQHDADQRRAGLQPHTPWTFAEIEPPQNELARYLGIE